MARIAERGSMASFIVVGIVLAGLVAGGIYVVKHGLGPFASESAPEVAVTEPNEDKPASTDGDQDPGTEQSDKDDAAQQNAEAEKKAQAEREAQEAKEREQQAQTDDSGQHASESEGTGGGNTPGESHELPQTGPAEVTATGIILAVVAGSVVAYRRSNNVL